MQEERAGFIAEGTFYPWPEGFRLGDTVLVCEITGLSWGEYADLLDTSSGNSDPRALVGMAAAAVWQANPKWTRGKVREFIERLSLDEIDFPDQANGNQENDARPPVRTGGDSPEALSPALIDVSEPTPSISGSPG